MPIISSDDDGGDSSSSGSSDDEPDIKIGAKRDADTGEVITPAEETGQGYVPDSEKGTAAEDGDTGGSGGSRDQLADVEVEVVDQETGEKKDVGEFSRGNIPEDVDPDSTGSTETEIKGIDPNAPESVQKRQRQLQRQQQELGEARQRKEDVEIRQKTLEARKTQASQSRRQRLNDRIQGLESREQTLENFEQRAEQNLQPLRSNLRRQRQIEDLRKQGSIPGASPQDFSGTSPNPVRGAAGDFVNPTEQVDENLNFAGEAVLAGQDIISRSEQFGENVGETVPSTERFGAEAAGSEIAAAELATQGRPIEAIETQTQPGIQNPLERKRGQEVTEGIAAGPGTLTGFAVGGAGAIGKSFEEAATGGQSVGQQVISGGETIASQVAEDPGSFIAEETGEEIGEGIATLGVGLAVPTITPTITPEPEVEPTPENSFVNERAEVIGTQTTADNTLNIPETEQIPDLGEQSIGRSREGVLESPESQILAQNLEKERSIAQPETGREAGVPEDRSGFTQEEVEVLERRRERQEGVENVETDIQRFAEVESERPTAEDIRFEQEGRDLTLEQQVKDTGEDSGLEGVLGGRRKGQTRGLPLVPDTDTVEPEVEPETGFDQTRTGRVETGDSLDDITIGDRTQTQQPEVPEDVTPTEDIDAGLAQSAGLGLSLDPTTGLQQAQQPLQQPGQTPVENIDFETEFLQETTQTPGSRDPTPEPIIEPELEFIPEPEIIPENRPETSRTPTSTRRFDFDNDREPDQRPETGPGFQLDSDTDFQTSVAGETGFGSEDITVTEEEIDEDSVLTGLEIRDL